jgi:hypothetical protein
MTAAHEPTGAPHIGDVRPLVARRETDPERVRAILSPAPTSLLELLPETPLIPPAAAAREALLEYTGMDSDEVVNWALQLADIIAAHLDAGGTVTLTDPDGTSVPLTMPTP